VGKVLSQRELDGWIEELSGADEPYEQGIERLVGRADSKSLELEICDPMGWRRPAGTDYSGTFTGQFRVDVGRIILLDREQELRLAKRLQFARLRLDREAGRCGAPCQDVDELLLSTEAPTSDLGRRACELQALRQELVERNLYLVLINVERYAKRGGSRDDLIQEGCIALFRAVDRFEWQRGLLFRTYAVHWLNQAFRSYIYNQSSTVRVPVYLQKALRHVRQAAIQLGKEDASTEELADYADLKPGLVRSALAAARGTYSIDLREDDSGTHRLGDALVDEKAPWGYTTDLEPISLGAGLRRALDGLPERDREVVEMRFGIGREQECTLSEVASRYGISLERVRQIQSRALGNLGTPRLRRELEPFLN